MRALVLSGGGSKGQYHVGVVQHLVGDLGISYDLMCGVSVGALIATHLCQYPKGQEQEAARALAELFSGIENKDVWKHWFPFKFLHGLWQGGILNSKPLRKLIQKKLNLQHVKVSGRELRIGATSLNTGEYRIFTQHDSPLNDIVYASAAFPVAFEPIEIDGQWWSDGGIRSVTPIKSAIFAGADTIDVVMTSPRYSNPSFNPDPNALSVAMRTVELMSDQIIDDDLKKALLYNKLIEAGVEHEKRHISFNVIRPSSLVNENALDFNPEEAVAIQLRGRTDAQAVVLK
jgi:NTE family protein